jgi:hypothetical protein
VHYQTSCGPSNCSGCCEAASVCAKGVNGVQCGQGGQQCQRCVPSEGTGQCVPQAGGGGLCNASTSCGPSNCQAGCCEGNLCVVGLSDAHCGNNAAPCQACPTGTQCVAAAGVGGQCSAVGTCGPQSCPGCCSGNVCAYGNQDIACGTAGAACNDCTAGGHRCISGICG